MKISPHISYKEATHSNTATRRGIDNDPNEDQLQNMQRLALMVFEPLRNHVAEPIKINSFFRSIELNKAIGGSSSSQHCCNDDSAAIDIDDNFCTMTNAEMFTYIKDNLDYDQLINEFPDADNNPSWVHVSYKKEGNRKQCLTAIRKNGRTSYVEYG